MISWWYKIFRPWFIVLLTTAFVHQLIEKLLLLHLPVIDSYLDPLLLMPVLLHLLLWERRILFRKGINYTFSTFQIILIFILISFVTEYIFPKWNPKFTADIWDVVCYVLGTIYFHIYHNVPYQKKCKQHISTP